MSRRYGRTRPKKHCVYSVEQVLALYAICRNTLTNWTKTGLRPVDDRRPQLFRGVELARFHTDRRLKTKQQLRQGEFRCVRCKLRVVPDTVTLKFRPTKWGALAEAACPDCGAKLFRLLDEATCDAYRKCLESNTSLHKLHEGNALIEAEIGTKSPVKLPRWNPDNERILAAYQDFCGKFAIQTRDAHIAAIREFELQLELKSFRAVTPEDAARYREHLAEQGRSLSSRSTITHRASHLASFFKWLVQQEGYRQMNHSIHGYFQLSRRDSAEAIKPKDRAIPELGTLERVVGMMPLQDPVARRNRTIVAASCLFGTRANATASLLLGDVDVEKHTVRQDATRVRVKNSKSQLTAWFPVGEVFERIVIEWIAEARELGLRDDDALFPPDADLAMTAPLLRPQRQEIRPWSTEDGVRRAFRLGCAAAAVPYINPHAVRHALAALGRDLCRTLEEEQAWSHNLGHSDIAITRSHYAKMTDVRRDALFATIGRRDPTPEEVKDLLLRYHAHELHPGTTEHEEARKLWLQRLTSKQR